MKGAERFSRKKSDEVSFHRQPFGDPTILRMCMIGGRTIEKRSAKRRSYLAKIENMNVIEVESDLLEK